MRCKIVNSAIRLTADVTFILIAYVLNADVFYGQVQPPGRIKHSFIPINPWEYFSDFELPREKTKIKLHGNQ